MHEDIFNFVTAHEAVQVRVSFEEDVIIAPSVCNWYHPVYRMLMIRVKPSDHLQFFCTTSKRKHTDNTCEDLRVCFGDKLPALLREFMLP